ncbi:MAG: hypothetical protein HFH53_08645 [Hespellia sp.]|nr:hypothetical protein [Hespellia sp.]
MIQKKKEVEGNALSSVVQHEVIGSRMIVEYTDYYEEDYQLAMLRQNQLSNLLEIELDGIGTITRFSYNIGNMVSMQTKYENRKIGREELQQFLRQFLSTIELLRQYMLNPDCLWLAPEYIFFRDEQCQFCYLPVRCVSLSEQFHQLTEFWVRQIDYGDTECICLAHKLNRETMEQQYDIHAILQQYESEASVRRELKKRDKERDDFIMKEEIEIKREEAFSDVEAVRELGGFQNSFQRVRSRMKKKRWGSWQDLILESDGQEAKTII